MWKSSWNGRSKHIPLLFETNLIILGATSLSKFRIREICAPWFFIFATTFFSGTYQCGLTTDKFCRVQRTTNIDGARSQIVLEWHGLIVYLQIFIWLNVGVLWHFYIYFNIWMIELNIEIGNLIDFLFEK